MRDLTQKIFYVLVADEGRKLYYHNSSLDAFVLKSTKYCTANAAMAICFTHK